MRTPASPPAGAAWAGGYAAWHPGGLHLEASIEKRIHVGNDLVRPLLAVTLRCSSKQLLTHAFAYVDPYLALLSLHRGRTTAEAPGRQGCPCGSWTQAQGSVLGTTWRGEPCCDCGVADCLSDSLLSCGTKGRQRRARVFGARVFGALLLRQLYVPGSEGSICRACGAVLWCGRVLVAAAAAPCTAPACHGRPWTAAI